MSKRIRDFLHRQTRFERWKRGIRRGGHLNAKFIKHESCPKCGSRDNVGLYSDGSRYCFGCGYYRHGDRTVSSVFRREVVQSGQPRQAGVLVLPEDTTKRLPVAGWKWLYKYGITEQEVDSHGIYWSDIAGGLIFAVFSGEGLVGYQVRNFQPTGKKYITYGRGLSMCLSLLEAQQAGEVLTFVEDMVSSIKVSRTAPCIPLLGSHIPLELIIRASERFSRFRLWLDMDKAKESVKQCLNAKQKGFAVSPVFSELDPKELTDEEIRSKLK